VSAIPSLLIELLQSFRDQIAFHSGLCNGLDLPDTSLSFHWDPSGAKLIHRLRGKPKLKKGECQYTHWAHMKLVTHIAIDTNLNSDMLLISKLRNMVLPSKTHHLSWDPRGSELAICIV
jgi:hypothetical protein